MAHVCVVNKADTAPPEGVETVLDSIRWANPDAKVVRAASPFLLEENGETIAGKARAAIEDGPTLTHGEMAYGAAVLAATRRTAPRSSSIPGRSRSARSSTPWRSTRTSPSCCRPWAMAASRWTS